MQTTVDVMGSTGRPEAERPEGRKQPAPSKTRREAGANQATAPQDPRGMAKAEMLEAQS